MNDLSSPCPYSQSTGLLLYSLTQVQLRRGITEQLWQGSGIQPGQPTTISSGKFCILVITTCQSECQILYISTIAKSRKG